MINIVLWGSQQLEPEQGRPPSFVESIQCVMAPGAGSNLTVTVSVGGQLSSPAPFNISYDAPRIKRCKASSLLLFSLRDYLSVTFHNGQRRFR